MNRLLSSPSLSTGEGKSCNLWYVINTGIREGGGSCLLPVCERERSYEIFYTRKYRGPTHARKTISRKFFQGKQKKEKEKLPTALETVRYENFGGTSIYIHSI